MQSEVWDVAVVGGGHNGLVAAAYLARAGLSVTVLERSQHMGGAAVSHQVFPDFDARLSRYAYLVSLLPDQIVEDLGLSFRTLARPVSSYSVSKSESLLIWPDAHERSAANFAQLTGGVDEFKAWQTFYAELGHLARVLAPTLLQKLPTRSELRQKVGSGIWQQLIETPLGQTLQARFSSDLVRGLVLTDGLIGTFANADDLRANTCFLYHVVGNGNGQWRVPEGGMGALVNQLLASCARSGVSLQTNTAVTALQRDAQWEIHTQNQKALRARFVLANCAPAHLQALLGQTTEPCSDGSQLKVNMLLRKLPRLKNGMDPRLVFAGTFHLNETFTELQSAHTQAAAGRMPQIIPAEMYCHSLTDTTILAPELISQGYHTLTLFALHLPASLFDHAHDQQKALALERLMQQLNQHLEDPIETCLARTANDLPCLEAKTPQELEAEVNLPRGHIFHGDLSMPFREDDAPATWGVETPDPQLFLCGAGAVRGGGISGIPGHNAAQAVWEQLGLVN